MFNKNIKKIVNIKKLMLIGLMLSFGAVVRPAAAGDIQKDASNKALTDEINRYKQGFKKIEDIGRYRSITEYDKELLSKLNYTKYYETLKKKVEHNPAPYSVKLYLDQINRLLQHEAESGKPDAIDRIKLLLEYNAQINFRFECNKTPLCLAAQNGHTDIVEFLIKNRATVDLPSYYRKDTPLFLAAQNGHIPVVECLIKNNADVNLKSGRDDETALYEAAKNGNVAVVECLLKNRADVNLGKWGKTPFFIAAENGHLPVIKCFLKNNAEVNQTKYLNTTPLLIAIKKGHNDIVTFLEQAGEKITDLQEALLEAAQNRGSQLIIDYLVNKRADVNYIPKDERTALYMAVFCNAKDNIEHLIAAGADINLAGPEERTPLCTAIDMEFSDVIAVLLNAHCLQLIAPFARVVKNINAKIKQQKDDTALSTNSIASTDLTALTTSEISALEKLPLECLWVVMQNLSSKSIGCFRQASRTCKNAAEYEYERQLRYSITLKKQDFEALMSQTLAHSTATRTVNRGMEMRTETLEVLQAASQRDFWQAALEAQPVRTHSEVMSDAQYEESCAEIDASQSRCAIS